MTDAIADELSAEHAPRSKRSRPVVALTAGLVGVVVVAISVLLATRPGPTAVNAGAALIGQPAPVIAGRSLSGSATVSLVAERGKFVFVDFFASWCAPCLREAPVLDAFLLEHAKQHNVAIVGVDIDDTSQAGARFLRDTFATWPAIEDVGGAASLAVAYGVDDPPQGYLVAPDGRVVDRVIGALTSPSQLDGLIASARAKAT